MNIAQSIERDANTEPKKRQNNYLPFEGDGGLFYQTWYPICLTSDVITGQVIGRDFLDGRVAIYRTEDGAAHVVSAYCPHIGADLSVGSVQGQNLQCAFHKWEYGVGGICVKTGIGDPAPRAARLFAFPTAEKYGIIWAFNGEDPLWELPEFEVPTERHEARALRMPDIYNCDGWIFCCNTPDMQHIKVVHGINFEGQDPHELVEWQKHGFDYPIVAKHQQGIGIEWQVGIRGTSFFRQQGMYDGWWLGAITAHSCPRPGQHEVFVYLAVDRGDGSPKALEEAQKRLDIAQDLLKRTVSEDFDILNTIHYRQGTLSRGDRSLAKFFDYLRQYPRAHPSKDYIN